MQSPAQHQRLAALRDVIADIERKPALMEGRAPLAQADGGAFPVLPGGLVQEVFADDLHEGGASLGFALAQARGLLTARRPTIFYVQMAGDGQALGLPYGPGLSWFGMDPAGLVMVRTTDMADFLWASEEVVSCRAVAAIIADIRGQPRLFNFTASRRLSLRAAGNQVSLFLLRYGSRRESSASHLRWRLAPHRSGRSPHDDRGLGPARWRLQLEKGRIAGQRAEWLLEWTKNGLAVFSGSRAAPAGRPAAAFPGAPSPLLGDRLSQAG